MKEIHDIRIKLWEQNKDLTAEQRIKKAQEITKEILSKLNIENRIVAEMVKIGK
jgi:PP-loop superfamily ATP-utilizing enzyme